ncbi:hypothetical protein [Allomesorhizobium camelthorni]|uniref:Uncharacterized protein n=1 Tax=Allomesorhizobium camelthorni TaxID=475069 RepID=A0A6G4WFG6_9HYPH|nr:hypothetical protein [Mesorhizobium camelthorni]NGO53349.1 hypothetical protein [Mesorhizobium camelthorni]
MTTLPCHSAPGEGLTGDDAADRIAFQPRDGATATAVCSVTTPTMLVCINLQDLGRAAHRGNRLSSKGPSPASIAKSGVGPLPERTTSIRGRNWPSPERAALPRRIIPLLAVDGLGPLRLVAE